MPDQSDLYHRLTATLRQLGYSAVGLETTDQNLGYGFVLTGLDRDGKPVPLHEVIKMQDALEADGSLDLDWDSYVGEDAQGYARITLG